MTNFTFSALLTFLTLSLGSWQREAIVSEEATLIFRQFCMCGGELFYCVCLFARKEQSFIFLGRQCPLGFTPLYPIDQTLAGHHPPFPLYTSHVPPFLQRVEVRHLLNIFKHNKSHHLQIYELGIKQQPFPQS